MTPEVAQLMNQLTLTQLTAQQLAMQCEIMLQSLQAAVKEAEVVPPPPPSTLQDQMDRGCRHPQGVRDHSARTMGKPDRFLCRLCGELVDGDTETSAPRA